MKRIALMLSLFLVIGLSACETDSNSQESSSEPIMEMPVAESSDDNSKDDNSNEDDSYDDDSYDDSDRDSYNDDDSYDDDSYDDDDADDDSDRDSESNDSNTSVDEEESTDAVFTTETLAYYDGKEGRPAYVAVDGIVYDLTNSDYWRNGSHYGGVTAGKDLTSQFANQHGDNRLARFPIVGTFVE